MNRSNIEMLPPDLATPPLTPASPSPGKRVKQVDEEYANGHVYHALYLPTDWQPGHKYPTIVEYAGNECGDCPGTVEGSNLGFGISGGQGVIWACLPFVDTQLKQNATRWWGDVEATVNYCRRTVQRLCAEYGGDSSAVFLAGFSRGAIACNYFTFQALPFPNHTDTWVLRDIPERKAARHWFRQASNPF